MFIQTEATPNPATLKFLPGRAVLEGRNARAASARTRRRSRHSPNGYSVSQASAGFLRLRFHRGDEGRRRVAAAKPMILGAIMEHFMSGVPLLAAGSAKQSDAVEFFDRPTPRPSPPSRS